jgi:hypothetical protein
VMSLSEEHLLGGIRGRFPLPHSVLKRARLTILEPAWVATLELFEQGLRL